MNASFPISRRSLLRGAGVSLALPFLEIARSKAPLLAETKAAAPVRMAILYVPNGVIPSRWAPNGIGHDYSLSPTLKSLEPHKSELLVISGLAQDNGRSKGDGPGDHAREASTFLTGVHPFKTAGTNIRAGISADQIAASKIGTLTKLPSLELGIDPGGNAGNCDSGYSCAYSSNIAWRTPTLPVSKEINPKFVFERMFGTPGADPASQARRDQLRISILDLVREEAKQLSRELGQTDRRKIDEYFTSVREVERKIEANLRPEIQRTAPSDAVAPSGVPLQFESHVHLMMDLLALAFQTDVTRIVTFMLSNSGSNRIYHEVGVKDGHHFLSHHKGREEQVEQLAKIDAFLVSQYSYLIGKLRSIKEGNGTLLDNCMIMYGGALGDGNVHLHDQLPIILAGRGGGTISPGRHITHKSETPLNNLLLSMMDRVGAPIDQFGDSTGRLVGLEG